MSTKLLGKGSKLGGTAERADTSHKVGIAKSCVRLTQILPLMVGSGRVRSSDS